MAPTVVHATRISSLTADFDACVASHADSLIEGPRVAGAVTRPRDRRHHHTVITAPHARSVGLDDDLDHAQVRRPPATSTLAPVIARASVRCTGPHTIVDFAER